MPLALTRLPARASVLALLVALSTLSAAVVGGAPARAAGEVVERPASGRFAVEGHGWGHGRGMSQWGAQGAATLGKTADEITSTYYPGTQKGSLPDAPVRIWISEDDETDLLVTAAGGLRVVDAASGSRYALPASATRHRVVASGSGLQVSSLVGGSWQAQGGVVAGPVRFGGPPLTRVVLPSGSSRDYRGTVTAVRSGSGLRTVVVMGMEEYLLGVVPRESVSSWEPAALQAQAIAARTYSAYKRDRVKAGAAYDLCDTTACHVFGGTRLISASGRVTELEPASTTAAVRATAGVIRTWDGRPALTEYSSSNGGHSTAGHVPYLVAKPDPWDGATRNHVHAWTATLTVAQLEARFPSIGSFQRLTVLERDGGGEWGGRVKAVLLEGSRGSTRTTGAGIYTAASWPGTSGGLRSSWWRISGASSTPAPARTPAPAQTPAPAPTTAPAASAVPLGSRTVQQSLTPTLQRPPGTSTGEVSVAVENTGRSAWPTRGLHLSSGTADALAPRGTYVGNRTTPGRSTVEPGEVATFRVPLDARRTAAGSHPRAFRLRVDDGPLFGTPVTWPLRVTAPRMTAQRVTAPPTVVLPTDGTATVALAYRNTGDLTWPATAFALGTSTPRNRASGVAGAGWTGTTRVGRLGADVAPGGVGTVQVPLHGGGRPPGVTVERVEPLWSGGGWLDGAVTSVTVVRTDPATSRVAMLHSAPRAVTLTRGARTTVVVRLRNLGRDAWTVGTEAISSRVAHPLRTREWGSVSRPPVLAANASRPGARTVEPGDLGEWRVPLQGTRPGTFPTTLVAVGPSGAYGPDARLVVTVR